MADITTYIDLSDSECQDGTEASDIRKNLLQDFATPAGKLARQSVTHIREHMQVYLRIRPFTNKELDQGESQDCMEQHPPSSLLMRAPKDSFTYKSSQRGFSSMTHKFTFSRIFGQDTCQKEFFDETMLGTVKDFIDGQNCLVFTYGVTNAGKTYTIQGVPQDGGILPRSLDVIFNSLEGRLFPSVMLKPRFFCDVTKLDERQRKKEEFVKESVLAMADGRTVKPEGVRESSSMDDVDDSRSSTYTSATEDSQSEISTQSISEDVTLPNVLDDINNRVPDDTSVDIEAQGPLKFSVWVSFAEIYNEYSYDLLEAIPKGKKIRRQALKLSEDKNGQIYIKGLKQISVQTADEAYKILQIGQQNLSMAATKLNQCSSRSHCIFSIKILRVVDVDDPHVARVSQLSFCDLAGSERYTRTQNTGDRLKEAGNINTSLLTLGKCIHMLRYNQNHHKSQPKIIPFRESKLTRLFQSFFLGKGKASMIVNVNQCASGFDETIQVLKFSAIAKQVTTVTSKLYNKRKVSADVPKLASARALSLAVRQSLSQNRMSVAWATPCPQTGEKIELPTVDESYLEEEDEDEEEEESEDEDDVEKTPKVSVLNQFAKTELVQFVEGLKAQLIEERKRNVTMEIQIREEVCQEMAQQLVKIEGEFKDQLEKDRFTTEEMFDKRLEMYEKSLKRKNTDDKLGEYEAALLREDQLKDQVTSLTEQVSVAEKALEEAKREYHEKLATTQDTRKDQVSKLESELKALREKTADLEEILADTQAQFDQTNIRGQQAAVRITSLENELEYLKEEICTEQKAHTETKKLASEYGCQVSELRSQLESAQKSTASNVESSEHVKELQQRLKELQQCLEETQQDLHDKEAEVSKFQSIATALKSHHETLTNKITAAEERCSTADEKVQQLSDQCSELQETIDQQEQELIEISAAEKKSRAEANKVQDEICQIKEAMSVEEKAHADSTKLALGYTTQISLLRSQLETAERTTAANAGLAKRNKELESALAEMQRTLTEREVALAEASKWQGSATDLRSQLKTLDDALKDSERQRSAADKTVQQLSKRCTDLQQTLAQKEQELIGSASVEENSKFQVEEALLEIQELKDKHAKEEAKVKSCEEELKEQATKAKSKADTIKSLMSKVEMQCLKEQALEKDAKAQNEMIEGLKSALQEQETTMASQDDILAAKEQELESLMNELEALQSKYSDSMKSSSDSMQEVRTANFNHERWNREKENIKKELLESQVKLSQTEQEREDFKIKLAESEDKQSKSNQEVNVLEQNLKESRSKLNDLEKRLAKTLEHPQDSPDKVRAAELEEKVASLEREITKLVADKEETLSKWRTERDELVKALEKRMTSLLETQKTNEAALAEKEEHIQHLKTKMMENLSDSQAMTDDDSDEEGAGKTRGQKGSKRARGKTSSVDKQLEKEVQQLRKQLEKETDDWQRAAVESKKDLKAKAKTISELENANQLLQQQIGLVGVTEDTKQSTERNSDFSSTDVRHSPSPQPPDSPDLFSVDVKDQESFHQPGRRRTRVEMDVTPLQKKQTPRKTRANTRKTKKRKSTELLEETDVDNFESCVDEGRSTRSTRSTRRTGKVAKLDTDAIDENIAEAKPADPPSSTRSKRAAFAKIGDLLQNSPLSKSAKRLMAGSPSKSPDVVACIAPPTTEKKRKRRLLKTDISEPFESSPFDVVKVGEPKGDNSHGIVTRKLRSRNTKV